MKKLVSIVLTCIMCISLAGCAGNQKAENLDSDGDSTEVTIKIMSWLADPVQSGIEKMNQEFMEEHPDIVNEFLAQHEAATEAINADMATAAQTINEEINAATGKSLELDVLNSAFQKIIVSTEINPDAMDDFAQVSLEQEFIDELPGENLIVTAE